MEKMEKGRAGEEAALLVYRALGFQLLARNWHYHRMAELDLILWRPGTPGLLVFCEVKYRSDASYSTPSAAVNGRKQQRIRLAAQGFLQRYPDYQTEDIRFDVAEVTGKDPGERKVILLEQAF